MEVPLFENKRSVKRVWLIMGARLPLTQRAARRNEQWEYETNKNIMI
jgi:hypothetical protein